MLFRYFFAVASLLLNLDAIPVPGPQVFRHGDLTLRPVQEVIERLNLQPHPEKGYFYATYTDSNTVNGRPVGTAIFYLMEGSAGPSYWHRVDAAEIWHHYAGAPMRMDLSWNNGTVTRQPILGDDIFEDDMSPQIFIEPNEWQRCESLGDWTLVGTTMAPGYTDEGWELAPPDWEPNNGSYNAPS